MELYEEYYSIDVAIQKISMNTEIICDEAQLIDLVRQKELKIYTWYAGALLHVSFDNYPEYSITAISYENKYFQVDHSEDLYSLIQNKVKEIELLGCINHEASTNKLLKGFQFIDEKKITPKILKTLSSEPLSYIELEELGILPVKIKYIRSDLRVKKSQVSDFIEKYNIKNKLSVKTSTVNNSDLKILLDSTHQYFSPDLAIAVQLWIECYKDQNPLSSSHESTVNDFLKRNYQNIEIATKAKERIQEITSPLKNWGIERKKRSNYIS